MVELLSGDRVLLALEGASGCLLGDVFTDDVTQIGGISRVAKLAHKLTSHVVAVPIVNRLSHFVCVPNCDLGIDPRT